MKSDLVLKKFSISMIPGTMNQKELRTFFGGKMIFTENVININDDTIDYSHVVSSFNNGYQYFDATTIPDEWETKYSENLIDLKMNNQSISLLSQTSSSYQNNTKWQININGASILTDYFYFRLKEQRVFKMINENELYYNDIDTGVYEYIKDNIFSRYRLENIKFYVKYFDLKIEQSLRKNVLLQYDPKYDYDAFATENLTNVNIIGFDPYRFDNIILQYNQSKPSNQYRFDYYFDLNFSKI
jgi:hypothetical protein